MADVQVGDTAEHPNGEAGQVVEVFMIGNTLTVRVETPNGLRLWPVYALASIARVSGN